MISTTGAHERLSPLRQAGVEERDLRLGSVRLTEIADLTLTRLRHIGTPPERISTELDLPDRTGRCAGTDPAVLCLAPGEWLFVSRVMTPDQLLKRLQTCMDGSLSLICDLSDGRVVLRLSGEAASWLLSKLSGLDFAGITRAGPYCGRTRLGDAAVTVHYHPVDHEQWSRSRERGNEIPGVFDMIADRSMAAYLWALLRNAAPHANELTRHFGAFS
jgi:heterotetrameric sarcosine oxidase gamma subunit